MLGDREAQLDRLARDRFDVAIVGGGITGAGVALDLTARGHRVALVEKSDYASGTSSRSSKLIHGGLRYLAQYQFGVTRESVRERGVLERLAPALIQSLPFVIPVSGGLLETARIALGLGLYELLAMGERRRPFTNVPLTTLREMAPGLDTRRMSTAFLYHDCRTDDARLCLAVLSAAARRGAVLANHTEAVGLVRSSGRVVGLEVLDHIGGRSLEVHARAVVLATGIWAERALPLDGGEPRLAVRPSKGVHLIVPRERLGFDVALYLPTGVDDRLVFVIPWQGRTLVGTTDTDYHGPLEAPATEAADVDYLLGVLNRAFPEHRLSASDVVGAQAGLRPLVASSGPSAHASREERVVTRPDGVVVVAGGKLTTYRRMALKVAAALRDQIGGPTGDPTSQIPIAPVGQGIETRTSLEDAAVRRLGHLYGEASDEVIGLARQPDLARPIVPGQSPIRAEVIYAVRHEHARKPGDVLARRSRLLLLDHAGTLKALPDVVRLMAKELGWSAAASRAAKADFAREAVQYGLPEWHTR